MKRVVPRLEGAARDVARGELIGLPVRIAGSTDPGIMGLRGTLVDETLKTVVVRLADGREVRLPKAGNVFAFPAPRGGTDVEVDGYSIQFRPEDRTKKVK